MLTTIIVEKAWQSPDGATPDGVVYFNLSQPITDPVEVPAVTIPSQLVSGAIAQPLVANDSEGAAPVTLYRVTEDVDGATQYSYYVSIPAAPDGSRSVSDAIVVRGEPGLISATAAFTSDDVGSYLFSPSAFVVGTQITAVIDAHTITTSNAALETAASMTVLIGAQVQLASLDQTT